MSETAKDCLLLIFAFFLGAVPFGFIAGRMRGIDLREHGSKNIGATNVMRVLGKGPGGVVLFLDAFKGFLPVMLARSLQRPDAWIVGIGMAAVLGHIYSPFVRFRGGKGVATALGVLLGFAPAVAGISLLVFLLALLPTGWVGLGSILGAATMAILFWVVPNGLWGIPTTLPYRLFATVVALFVIYRHRGNIQRMLNGTENRVFTWKKKS